jgi:hypothetical protein
VVEAAAGLDVAVADADADPVRVPLQALDVPPTVEGGGAARAEVVLIEAVREACVERVEGDESRSNF